MGNTSVSALLLIILCSLVLVQPVVAAVEGKIAFLSYRDSGGEIYVMNPDGTGQTRLTFNTVYDGEPAWSPDGLKIAFVSYRDGNDEIYIMNSDGSDQTRLTSNSAYDREPAWSPDGLKIAFVSYRDGNDEIYVMNSDGSDQTRLTSNSAYDREPAWSPDGSKIAFGSWRDGNSDICIINEDGSGLTCLTSNTVYDGEPEWSPDGSKIAFTSNRDGIYGNRSIYLMNSDGSGQTRLTSNMEYNYYPAWSPDGMKITFTSGRDGNGEIYVMNSDGSGQTRLTSNTVYDEQPDWGVNPQARTVTPVLVLPYGYLPSGTPVTAEFSINAVGMYPSDGEEQLSTDLDNPSWTYTIVVNGIENLRPVFSGSSLVISGFELSYKTTDQVSARITLRGDAPRRDPPLMNFTIVKIQSVYGNNTVVPGSVVSVEGQTTATNPPVTNAKTPVGVFRPSNGNWYLDYNKTGTVDRAFHFGTNGDIPVVGDWNNDNVSDYGVFRPLNGNWYLETAKTGVVDTSFHFGKGGDIPVVGDWDGNGVSDAGVFRPSNGNWYLETTKTGVVDTAFHFGKMGDIPVVGDWDGDGVSDAGVFRPSNGNWYLETTKTGIVDNAFHFGTDGDIPVVGDWGGDVTVMGEGRIAFVSNRNNGNYEIYVMKPDGTGQTRITNNTADYVHPAWSPDGSKIAFQSSLEGNDEIYVMNADGTGKINITKNAAYDWSPSYSPDGTKIAFASGRRGSQEIYVMNADGSEQTRLTDTMGFNNNPSYSPDGSKIAFTCSLAPYNQVCVIDTEGTGQIPITSNATNNQMPAWSPDGTKIAFVSFQDGNYQTCVMNSDGTGQTRLTYNPSHNTDPVWSPDGSRIAFESDREGQREIYVMNADGTGQTRLTYSTADFNRADDWEPDWGISAVAPNKSTQIGVFRPSNGNWYLDYDKNRFVDKTFHFGKAGDIPVVGDWDGDGASDAGIFRPSNGNWYLDTTQTGMVNKSFHFGAAGDSPFADYGTTITRLPTLEKIVPDEGTAGTQILVTALTGTNFQPTATVTLMMGDNPNITADNVKVQSPTLITCTFNLPLTASGGAWDIVLTNPDGHFVKGSGMFSVHPALQPTITPPSSHGITSISPTFTTGNNVEMLITGSDFQFGDITAKLTKSSGSITLINARNVVWHSTRQVTAYFTIPHGSTGIWNVVVTNPDGSTRSLENGFEVRMIPTPQPTITITRDMTIIPGTTVSGRGNVIWKNDDPFPRSGSF
jgi:Tol biopolymer transport system component